MGNEKFCLRWNDFESNISVAFRELREDKDFFDVTLACDDEQIQAHKVILSACSPFFRTVLRRNPHAHPLLYLRGVRFSDLQSVLTFMYNGEVNVAQEELNSFLMVAEELRVKGLTQTQGEGAKASPPASMPSRPESQPLPLLAASSPLPSTPPPAKRPRPSTAPSLSFPNNTQPEVQEISMPPVKSEPMSSGPDESTSLAPLYPDEEQYEDYPEEEHYAEDQYSHQGHHSSGEVNKGSLSPEDLAQYIVSDATVKEYHCAICNVFKAKLPSKVKNHLEAIHFPGMFLYTCDICRKTFKGKNALNIHKSTIHPKKARLLSVNPLI